MFYEILGMSHAYLRYILLTSLEFALTSLLPTILMIVYLVTLKYVYVVLIVFIISKILIFLTVLYNHIDYMKRHSIEIFDEYIKICGNGEEYTVKRDLITQAIRYQPDSFGLLTPTYFNYGFYLCRIDFKNGDTIELSSIVFNNISKSILGEVQVKKAEYIYMTNGCKAGKNR